MLEHVLDNKRVINKDDIKLIDLTTSIFANEKNSRIILSVYKVPDYMKMRMDLISNAAYGTDEYTDLLMKYNDISNPFIINTDDIIFVPSLDTIESDLAKPVLFNDTADKIRNYHRYIDKNKAPKTVGSEVNNKVIPKNAEYVEANLAPANKSSITLRNGRIYFGDNSNIECSVDGITSSDFLLSKIENEI